MFYVEIFLLLIFTVLCGILLALWRIREQLDRLIADKAPLAAAPTTSTTAAGAGARPPAA